MIGWLRRLTGASRGDRGTRSRKPQQADDGPRDRAGADYYLQPRRTVSQVFDEFYARNPQRTPFGIHRLCEAGAASLENDEDLRAVCDRIAKHCNMDPISPTLRKSLGNDRLLAYLRWHAANDIDEEQYRDGRSIIELVRRFEKDTSQP